MNTDFLNFADRAWEITYECQRESQKCSYERKWTYEVDVNTAPGVSVLNLRLYMTKLAIHLIHQS